MAKSGEVCESAGIYRSGCCGQDVLSWAGNLLPTCPKCFGSPEWTLVVQVPTEGLHDLRKKKSAGGS